jgi:hypothetical protein
MSDSLSFSTEPPRISRRDLLQWFTAVSASLALGQWPGAADAADAPAKGYGTDPDLSKIYKPGDFWPLTLDGAQRKTVTSLADVILPADHLGPAASALGVPAFVDEWISAPYPQQQTDRATILEGLRWIEEESKRRFAKDFSAVSDAERHQICSDIAHAPAVKPEWKNAARFFSRFRALCSAAYFSTPEGWKVIGYVGNVPTVTFDGPPPEVLARLGVEQTVR